MHLFAPGGEVSDFARAAPSSSKLDESDACLDTFAFVNDGEMGKRSQVSFEGTMAAPIVPSKSCHVRLTVSALNQDELRNEEKGGLAKGACAESSVTPKETKNTRGHWAQQYIWHSERHSQERHTFLQKPPLKPP